MGDGLVFGERGDREPGCEYFGECAFAEREGGSGGGEAVHVELVFGPMQGGVTVEWRETRKGEHYSRDKGSGAGFGGEEVLIWERGIKDCD